jgi:hypothetical protein
MKRPAAVFTIALALAAIVLAPRGGARAQDRREEIPLEIEKCQTIDKPGSYKLVNNLTFTGSPNTGCLISGPSFWGRDNGAATPGIRCCLQLNRNGCNNTNNVAP